jgi:hypothetical protein
LLMGEAAHKSMNKRIRDSVIKHGLTRRHRIIFRRSFREPAAPNVALFHRLLLPLLISHH